MCYFYVGACFSEIDIQGGMLAIWRGEGQLIETILKVCGFAIFCWTLLEYPWNAEFLYKIPFPL